MTAVVILLTLEETADRLRKSLPTARWMMKNGDFPRAAKIGGRWMVRESDLDAYLAAKFRDAA